MYGALFGSVISSQLFYSASQSTGSLFTSWDVSTYSFIASSSNAQTMLPSGSLQSTGIYVKADETKLWLSNDSFDYLHQYTMSTPGDLSTLAWDWSFDYSTSYNMQEIFWKPDGTKFFMCNYSTGLLEFACSTPWDNRTASYTTDEAIFAQCLGVFFHPDGDRMWACGNLTDEVREYTLSTAWDLASTVTQVGSYFYEAATTPHMVHFNADGTQFYYRHTGNEIRQYNLSTPYDLSTTGSLSPYTSASIAEVDTVNGMCLLDDGTFYTMHRASDYVAKFSMGTL